MFVEQIRMNAHAIGNNRVKDILVSDSEWAGGYTLVRKFLDLSAHIRILCPELVLSPRRMNSF